MTRTMKNTLKCVLVLFVIAVVSVGLLTVASKFLKVVPRLDQKTANLINGIAPTGLSDTAAFKEKRIKLIDLSKSSYLITDLTVFNKEYGGNGIEVRALYTSTDALGKITHVVESQGNGYVGPIVTLTAYDAQNKISGIVIKSHTESYFNHIKDLDSFYLSFVGLSGTITSKQIIANTGATVKGTVGGIAAAVSIANEFVAAIGGEEEVIPPAIVTDAEIVNKLKKVSTATVFTKYTTVGSAKKKVSAVYKGDNGDLIYEALGNGGGYGEVTLFITANSDKTLNKLTIAENSFDPNSTNDSSNLQLDDFVNAIFAGKSAADVKGMGMGSSIGGTTGVTESSDGLKQAVINALEYIDTFAKEAH